jgi:hypothetical protein
VPRDVSQPIALDAAARWVENNQGTNDMDRLRLKMADALDECAVNARNFDVEHFDARMSPRFQDQSLP